MKILVTGSSGFIGRNLIGKLISEGHKVIGIDISGRDTSINYDYHRVDITRFEELYKLFKRYNGRFDFVIHTAGEVGRLNGEDFPQRMIYTNLIGTLNLITLSLESGSKFIYFSTSEIYGKMFNYKEVSEEDAFKVSVFDVTNIYALSKLTGEGLVYHFVMNYDLLAVTIRPFMIYGPGNDPNKLYKSAIDEFVLRALKGQKLLVHENTERAWCHVRDFVDGVLLILNKHEFIPQKYEAYNIGTSDYISSLELAKLILKITQRSESLIEVVDFPKRFTIRSKRFSLRKIESLGYKPKVSLEEGIKEVVEWYKKSLCH